METINGSLANKTVILVNTGSLKKKFIVQRLKKVGLNVIILNKEKNWAQPYADDWIIADTTNHREALSATGNYLKSNPDKKVDGVLTFWEDDVLLTAKLADRFNFIGIPYNVAKKARNKFLFREFCKENGISAPEYKIIKAKEDLDFVCEHFSFPLVIKPTYGSSSAYVVKVENKDELLNTYEYLLKNISADTESSLADGTDILVEEYIDGDEVDIDILLQNGKIKFFSITDNDRTNEPFFIETGQSIPSSLPKKNQQDLIELAEETLEKMGVQNACVHFEAKSTKNGPVPIEVNLRMGGDEVHSFVKGAWGVDLIENAVKIALGVYINKINKPETPRQYITGKYFLSEYSGILVKLDVDPSIKNDANLGEIYFFKEIGDSVLVPPEGYEFLGWLTVTGDNHIDAMDNLRTISKKISYEVVKFDAESSLGKTLRKNRFAPAVLNKDLMRGAAKIARVSRASRENQRNLHIGILSNQYEANPTAIEANQNAINSAIIETLKNRGYKVTLFDFSNFTKTFNELKESDVDLVLNNCEQINNLNFMKAEAAAILEALQIPYTGSNSLTLGLCKDKIYAKKLLSHHNIPTPKWDYAYSMEEEISADLRYPLIVKPAYTDNSIGITNESVVNDREELRAQLKHVIVDSGFPALVEEYIEGDEYEVTILGNDQSNLRIFPLSRSIFSNLPESYRHIYSYDAKWSNDPVYKNIIVQQPLKNVSKKLEALLSEISLDAYNLLDCRDYSLIEIRVDKDNTPYLLEVNPNPPLLPNTVIPNVASLLNMNYGDLLEEIISVAIKRYKNISLK